MIKVLNKKKTKEEKKEKKPEKIEKKESPKLKISLLPVKMTFSELIKRKEEIETLLASLEDEYREATVSEKSYKEIKHKNLEKLEEVKKRIEEMQKAAEGHAFAPPPQTIQAKVQTLEPSLEASEESETPTRTVEKSKPLSVVITPVTKEEFEEATKDLKKLMIDVEKMKTLVESIKEVRAGTEEKIQRLTESVGEIRSMAFQKEAEIGEIETKFEKLNEMVQELKPEKIARELGKRDKEIGTHEARLEKLEIKTEDVLKRTKEIQNILENIGNLENIINVSKNVAEKTAKIDKSVKEIERLSDKVEKLYVELSKKLEEFTIYKSKQDSMEELTQELVKTIDQINIKFDEYAKSEELASLRESITSIDKELETTKKRTSVVKALPPELQNLQKQKEEIEMLLSSVEEEYKNRGIPESEYQKIKETNLKKLEDVKKKIKKAWKKLKPPEEEGIPPLEMKAEEKVEESILREVPSTLETKPEPVESEPVEPKPIEVKQETKKLKSKKERMIMELQELYTKGLITQSALERTKKMLMK